MKNPILTIFVFGFKSMLFFAFVLLLVSITTKAGQNKKGKKISSCTTFFYSWQLRKRIQKTLQREKCFGPSYFVKALDSLQ
jgi:hypothetical protein